MNRIATCLVILLWVAGCGLAVQRSPTPTAPSVGPSTSINVAVYMDAIPGHSRTTEFTLQSVEARTSDGTLVALTLAAGDPIGGASGRDRLIATGILPDGAFEGLRITCRDPIVRIGGETAALRMNEPTTLVPVPFSIAKRDAVVLHVRFDPRASVEEGTTFRPAFRADVSPDIVPGVIAAVSIPDADVVALVDKTTGRVRDLIRTGRGPSGIALDVIRRRLYVALAKDHAVEVYDLPDGALLDRVRLASGDETIDVALTPDGETILAANPGSGTVSVIEAFNAFERLRVRIGDDPFETIVSPDGTRAYVVDRRSDAVVVLTLPTGARRATISTEARPTRVALDDTGETLYVAHDRSANLLSFDTSTLGNTGRLLVGPGATAILLDGIRGRLYVARHDASTIQAFEAGSQLPLEDIAADEDVSFLALDAESNRLALVRSAAGELRMIDAVRYRDVFRVDLPGHPFEVAFFQQR